MNTNHTALKNKVLAFAAEAHAGEFRRGGEPYIKHIERAMGNAYFLYASPMTIIFSGLHDIFEQGCKSRAEVETFLRSVLFESMVSHAMAGLDALTHKEGQSYEEYIRGIKDFPDRHVVVAKAGDVLDNTTDSPSEKQRNKYRRALEILRNEE